MNENREYKFKLLNETSATEDLFEDKTHQKIADTLYNVIQNGNSEGITIGLEGGWGSGKSTVVSILKNKIDTIKNTIYFYFDAWEHEGDPLRRIFLEALIDQVINYYNKNVLDQIDLKLLENIKNKISNREKRTVIKTTRTATTLGKILSIASLFIPLGAAIISGTVSKLRFELKDDIYWLFLFGLIFALAPVFVILGNCFLLWKANKKISDFRNWMFLQSDSEEDSTQEVSEDEERSSIEFERFFREILDIIFLKNKNAKLLIVIDNLDRIDADFSLRIWSTLQTFLQRKNPTDKGPLYLEKIWVLVPYDEEGLEKLWRNHALKQINDENSDDINEGCAKSFFDKCFQLRIEVPKLILTGWEAFCLENINQALIGWNDNEKKDVVDILKLTRKNVGDIPSPRDIKTYVNQIGLLRMHCDRQISTKAIAFFAVEKYINFQKNSIIEKGLIDGKIPDKKYKPILPEQLTADLCGILFGVSAKKGQQLLLGPEIEKALSSKDFDGIKEMSEIHKNAFWTMLNLILPNMNDIEKMKNYSFTISKGLWQTAPDKCREFVSYLKESFDKLTSLNFPEQNDVDTYEAMFLLLDFGEYDFSNIWKFIITSLNAKMKEPSFINKNGHKILSVLVACQKKKIPSLYTLEGISLEHWKRWAVASGTDKINSYDFVVPPATIVNDIATTIMQGNPLPDKLYDLIIYLLKGRILHWQPVINNLQLYIQWNEGTQSENVFSIEILRILLLLSANSQESFKSIEPILSNGSFYNLTFHLNSQGSVKYAALLFARYFYENLDSIQISPIVNSEQGLQETKSFWKTKNNINAQFIWDEIKSNSDFDFIWKLAKNESNKLVGDIIKIAVKDNCLAFFNLKNALALFKASINITDNENTFYTELIKCFIENSQIEDEILGYRDIDIITFDFELYLLVENTKNKNIINYLIEKINFITKEEWETSLRKKTHLTTLALTLNEKSSGLNLTNDLYEPLLSYLRAWISNSVSPDEVQQNELPVLITLLNDNFRIQVRDRLTNHIIENSFKGNPNAISALIEYINISKIVTEYKEKIQITVEDSLKKSEIDTLKILDLILSHQDSAKFKPDRQLAEVFRTPMKLLLRNSNEETNKALIERLALKFRVDLTSGNLKVNEIIISSAMYGKGDTMKDVTNIVKTLVNDLINNTKAEKVSFEVTNANLGGEENDPVKGEVKELKITYSYLREEQTITVPEYKTVTIP